MIRDFFIYRLFGNKKRINGDEEIVDIYKACVIASFFILYNYGHG